VALRLQMLLVRLLFSLTPEAPHHRGNPLGVGMDRRVAVGTEATNKSGESCPSMYFFSADSENSLSVQTTSNQTPSRRA